MENKKKAMKAWAVVELETGEIMGNQMKGPLKCSMIYTNRKSADAFAAMFYLTTVIPCTVTYEVKKP